MQYNPNDGEPTSNSPNISTLESYTDAIVGDTIVSFNSTSGQPVVISDELATTLGVDADGYRYTIFDNGFAQWSSAFLCMSKETNQRKHIPQSSPLGALVFDKNKRSALCHIPVAKRLKSTSCCLNPLFVSTLDLMKGKQAA